MPKKLLLLVLLFSLLFVPYGRTFSYAPSFSITVNENTVGGDGNFAFHELGYFSSQQFPYTSLNFNIQTVNGFGTRFLDTSAASNGDRYYITQDPLPGWQNTTVNCISDNSSAIFQPTDNGVIVTVYNPSSVTCNFSNVKQNSKVPMLFVPGILGTEIKKDNTILWASVLRMVDPLNLDSFMDPLQFNSNLMPSDNQVYVSKVIDNPDGRYNYSEGLIEEFQNLGYVESPTSSDATLFTFPYDWRYGITGVITGTSSTTVDLLKRKIDQIIAQTGSDKVDIVAHSTGGLLVKDYVMENPTNNHIDKAVFVGVPNLGAPKAIKVLLEGDGFGVPGLEDSEMQKIALNLPVTYDLSPSQEYENENGSYIKIVTSQGFGSTVQNLDFPQTDNFLINGHQFNSQALQAAHQLHSTEFDNYDLRNEGVDLYSIIGCKTGTIGNITEYRTQGQADTVVTGYDTGSISGDGTVPVVSANSLAINSDHQFYALKAEHGKMPSADGIRQEIVNIISGSSLDTGNNIISQQDLASDPSKCQLQGHWWQIFSPVSIGVTDQEGNYSGIAPDGSIQNDIPGADYEVMGEHKFVFVPTDEGQTYTTNLTGTGNGTFTFKDGVITNDQVTQTQVFSNLSVTTQLTGTVNLGTNGGETTLDIQATPSSTPVVVEPSSVVDANQSEDLTAPVSTSTITGLIGQPGFYRSNVRVNLSASDPVVNNDPSQTSGVLKISYNLDNQGYQTYNTSSPITIITEGQHVLSFFSTDNAGNNEQEQTIGFTIDKTAPEFAIQFNPIIQDLQFTATDTSSTLSSSTVATLIKKGFKDFPKQPVVRVVDSDDTITATDAAGNVTQIMLTDKNRKKAMKAQLQSLSYNSQAADISKAVLKFNWAYNKQGNLTALEQHVKSKKDFNVDAIYSPNQTILTGKDQSGKINKSINGLDLLTVTTNQGDLNWNY